MRELTKNSAAADVRHKILVKMRRMFKKHPELSANKAWGELVVYIKAMPRRANKRKGGLGKA